jgi:hypothetical protein
MSDLSPLSGVKRTLDFGAVRSASDPERTSGPNGRRLLRRLNVFRPDNSEISKLESGTGLTKLSHLRQNFTYGTG